MRRSFVVTVAAVLVSACGGGGGGGGAATRTVSCDFSGDVCDTLVAPMTDAQQATLQADCTGAGGAFTTAACPTAGMLAGTCRYTGTALANLGFNFPGGTMTEYYYQAGWTAGSAQVYCESPPAGVWVP